MGTASFFQVLRYSSGISDEMPAGISSSEWEQIYETSRRQSLLGVIFHGIERSGVEKPDRQLLLQWYSLSKQIRQRNEQLNRRSAEIVRLLEKEGFRCCILKGQGNAAMYPAPLSRTPGDIDVWVDGSRQEAMALVRQHFPNTHLRYHHVDFPIFRDVTTEVHFVPSSMNNPFYNRRLRRWFEANKNGQFSHFACLPDDAGRIPVPTNGFNLIYQLSHLMHHFFDEGIGLRQMMDYCFVLKNAGSMDKEALARELKHLGLYKFAGAVMYVMQEAFGLEEALMVAPVDARRGRTLMAEILNGGNFGQHSGLTEHGTGVKYFLKIRRSLRFVREYPSEALCEPVFRTWHFFWRLFHRR